MKKFAIALAILMFLMIVACGGSGTNQAEGAKERELENVWNEGYTHVVRHKDTGVC